jgi:hypothetical protein
MGSGKSECGMRKTHRAERIVHSVRKAEESEVGKLKKGFRCRVSEDRRQKTDDRGQRAEDRRQRAEGL